MTRLASLADGQLANSVAALYTVPEGSRVRITSIHVFSTHASSQTVNVYVTRKGSTRRQTYKSTLAQYATFNMLSSGETFNLSSGDSIDGDTTNAASVDYLITGEIE